MNKEIFIIIEVAVAFCLFVILLEELNNKMRKRFDQLETKLGLRDKEDKKDE